VAELIVGSEALAQGVVTRQMLRSRYVKVHHNVYAPNGAALDPATRARAAWLWSGRRATLVGYSAAALLGSRWLPRDAPAEIARVRHPAPNGIVIRSGTISYEELCVRDGMRCTDAARTAYDIGRRVHGDVAIAQIDALLNATGAAAGDVERIASRYPGARGVRQLRATLGVVDAGAESPQETRLRLLLVRSGLPRPVTQIPVGNRRIDMGYPDAKVGVEYDGEHHFTNPDDYANDIDRLEFLAGMGWLIVRVSARQLRYQKPVVVQRVRDALARR
jgi:very-short-patch-repair endonuclease